MDLGKGDPPPPSSSAKDIRRDQDLDSRIKDPPPLPPHLRDHERKASRVDVEVCRFYSCMRRALELMYISFPDALCRYAHRCVSSLALHPSELHPVLCYS